MNTEQSNVLKEYAVIKAEIKALEEKAETLNPSVLAIMQDADVEELTLTDLGKLTLGSRRAWTYPEPILEKEKALKAEKKEAEQLGTATYEEKQYVIFKKISE
jgi:hypothetical protein